MAIYLQDFQIDCFRGIRNLNIRGLNHINLIVGDNNCGKTSVLESLLLLRNPGDLANVLRIARQRETTFFYGRTPMYDNFINLFPHDKQGSEIRISALFKHEPVEYFLHGEQKQILLDEIELSRQKLLFVNRQRNRDMPGNTETTAFVGAMDYRIGNKQHRKPVSLHEFSHISGMEINKDNMIDMLYLSPIDHMRGNILNNIVRNDDYKAICLRVIQIFDSDIIDLLILNNEQTNRPVEYIKHRVLGNMPISTYGDGIKKVLFLANAIAQTAGGVLLIDEVETAIHSKYYDDIFRFLVKTCMQFGVQVFITTHNLEAVDALLATQDYGEQAVQDEISIITLKKSSERTYSRILPGRKVQENRESFDFEVRL